MVTRGARIVSVLALACALGLVVLFLRDLDLAQAGARLRAVGWGWLWVPAVFGFELGVDAAASARLFRAVGRRVPLRRLYKVRLCGDAVLLGVLGGAALAEAVPPYLLHREAGVPVAESVATGGVRKVLLLAAQGLYLGLGVAVGGASLVAASRALSLGWALPALSVLASVILVFVGLSAWFVLTRAGVAAALHRGLVRLPGQRLRRRFLEWERHFHEIDAHFDAGFRRPHAGHGGTALLFFLVWLCETVEVYVLLRFAGIDLGFASVWAVEPAVSLLRHMLFFLPAGIGAQDLSYGVLIAAMLPGAPMEAIAAFLVLKRSREVLFTVTGLGWLSLSGFRLGRAAALGDAAQAPEKRE